MSPCWKTPTSCCRDKEDLHHSRFAARYLSRSRKPASPLLIIAEDVDRRSAGDTGREQYPWHPQDLRGKSAPGFGDRRKAMLEDIAILTGGTGHCRGSRPVARESYARRFGPGQAHRESTRKTPSIIDGAGDAKAIEGRVKQVYASRSKTRPARITTSEKLQERVAKLAGGVALIKVGAATEVEMKEKKARVEDALHSTRAAVEEGIVARRRRGIAAGANRAWVNVKGDNHGSGFRHQDRAARPGRTPAHASSQNGGDEPSVVAATKSSKARVTMVTTPPDRPPTVIMLEMGVAGSEPKSRGFGPAERCFRWPA